MSQFPDLRTVSCPVNIWQLPCDVREKSPPKSQHFQENLWLAYIRSASTLTRSDFADITRSPSGINKTHSRDTCVIHICLETGEEGNFLSTLLDIDFDTEMACSALLGSCTIGIHLGLEDQCHRLDYTQKLKV